MKKKFYQVIFCCLVLFTQKVRSQVPVAINTTDTIVTANPEYNKAGSVKRLFLGEHYRKEWATPVSLKVLNMDSTAGGLTTLKLGGGHQTKSLRLRGADGKEYVLRSVNKDPSKALAPEFVGTFAADIVQDQISSSNPYAPVVVAALSEAAGIYHATPEIVYVPASSRLGSFSNDFANSICLFEERPTGDQTSNAAFGYADDIVNSQKLFEKIFSNNDHHVDEKAYLKARLFDMWIGDWDRHEDQWMWAAFKKDGKTIYKPIPRDRDQAFASLDGIIPGMAAKPWMVRRTQNFDYTIKDINGLNMSAAFLDRNFTTTLSQQDWTDVAKSLQQNLADEKIEAVFKLLPPNIYDISATSIIAKLKSRKADLVEYAIEYYKFVNREVNITGTSGNEQFEVRRIDNDSTEVKVYGLDKNDQKRDLFYHRVFLHSETKEIRLYGLNGKDKFNLEGKVDKSILVRVIGGEGTDSTSDASTVKAGSRKTKVYDNNQDLISESRETKTYVSNDSLKNNYNRAAFKYDWIAPKLAPAYNSDDGLYLGGGVTIKKQQFGKAPYGYMQSLWGNYAFATGAYNFGYEGIFTEAVGKWDLHITAKLNAPNYVINYYGLGNETVEEVDDKDYYRVRTNQLIVSPSLERRIGKHHAVGVGLNFASVKIGSNEGRFVSDDGSKLDSAVFERNYFGGINVSYHFNTTDNPLYPRRGVKINSTAAFIQNLKESNTNYGKLSSDISFYASHRSLTAAVRVGAATNIGNDYEFYQANSIGSATNLRGYNRSRYAGKTSLYQNAELRYKFPGMNGYILRGNWGLLAFFDNGRVWMPDENSNKWHCGYGGGIWFLPYNKMAFTATYGVSKDDKSINIKAGFFF